MDPFFDLDNASAPRQPHEEFVVRRLGISARGVLIMPAHVNRADLSFQSDSALFERQEVPLERAR